MRGVAWIGRHILAVLERLFETKVDEPRCRWANLTHEGRGDDD